MNEYHLEESEINALVLMVTNAGVGEVLDAISQIADGFFDVAISVSPDKTMSNKTATMWSDTSKAVKSVATKVKNIESRYRARIESQKMIEGMIEQAVRQTMAKEASR